jgi:hypothetical protein
MRKTFHGTVAVFILSGLLLQWAARWSPVVFSRLYPPGGRTETVSPEDPATIAIAEED